MDKIKCSVALKIIVRLYKNIFLHVQYINHRRGNLSQITYIFLSYYQYYISIKNTLILHCSHNILSAQAIALLINSSSNFYLYISIPFGHTFRKELKFLISL